MIGTVTPAGLRSYPRGADRLQPGVPLTVRRQSTAPALTALLGTLLSFLPVLPPAPLGAQRVEREVQVPLDSVRAVVEVSPELRRELGLFPDVRDFVVARLFVTGDGREILEISFRENGRLVRERRTLGPGDLLELRARVAEGLASRGATSALDREGRGGLVLAETVLGLGFYGWAVPEVLNIESTRGQVAAYLLTAGASFLLPYRLTRSISVRDAHRDAVVWGGTRGIVYGLLLGDALTGGENGSAFDEPTIAPTGVVEVADDDDDRRVVVGLGLLGSLAGQFLGYRIVDAARADRGDVALWSTVGDLALGYGFGTAYALGLYDGETRCSGDLCTTADAERRPAGHVATMGVGLVGLWAAHRVSRAEEYTVGDARALLSAGLLGAQVVLPLSWAVFDDADDGEKALAATLVGGSVAGLWLGNRTLRGYALTPSEGLLVQAGHVAGGLTALGIAYLIDDDPDGELLYMSASTLGSLAGALLTFRAVARGSEAPPGGTASGPPPPRDRTPGVRITPLGAAPLLLGGGIDGGPRRRLPLVSVRW